MAFVAGLYNLGIFGMRALCATSPSRTQALSRTFLHTLVPIAFGYMLAHYFSLLVLDGQALGYLVSDPLGRGTTSSGPPTSLSTTT